MKIRDRIKAIRRVPARDLLPNPKNWRSHPPAQRDALQGLLAELGYCDAAIARELPDGRLQLIDGHLRCETTPDMEVPVLVLDVTDAEADKLLVDPRPPRRPRGGQSRSADRAAGLGRDRQRGGAGPAGRPGGGGTHPLPGPGGDGGLDRPGRGPPAPRRAGHPARGPVAAGPPRLLCGDSSRPEDVDRLLGGAAVHLVNTDPPYNVGVEPRSNNAIAAGLSSFRGPRTTSRRTPSATPSPAQPAARKLRAKDRPLDNDFVGEEEFERLLRAWFGNVARVLLPGRGFYVWGGYSNIGNYPPALKECGLYFSQGIVWDKQHPVLTRKDFMGCFELAFYGWRRGPPTSSSGPTTRRTSGRSRRSTPRA